jgi:hypothetical protein
MTTYFTLRLARPRYSLPVNAAEIHTPVILHTPRALCCPSHGAMSPLGYIFLGTGLAMEEL